MADLVRILDSAYKHGIRKEEILLLLDERNETLRSYPLHEDQDGNPQEMLVGHTGTRSWPIEIGVCYRATEPVVFHAAKLTPEFRKLYEAEP
jgi:hypothetical protein